MGAVVVCERPAVLVLGRRAACWSRKLVGADVVVCESAEEVRAYLAAGRPFRVVLADASTPGVDRDLLDATTGRGRDPLGAAAGGGGDLLGAPTDVERRLRRRVGAPVEDSAGGRLVAVTGPGGTGVSTVAMALARELPHALLCDFRLHAELAYLHGIGDGAAGVDTLVRIAGVRRPTSEHLAATTVAVPAQRYRLLPGLPSSDAWSVIRPLAFRAALDAARRSFASVVADIEPDLEGETDGGSIEVEERNVMARTVCAHADVCVVVGTGGRKGRHASARVVGALRAFGVPQSRIVTVLNGVDHTSAGPFLEGAVFDDGRLVTAVTSTPARRAEDGPRRVMPGQLGAWPA